MGSREPVGILNAVRDYHRYLGELLCLHQEALLERDLPLAVAFWELHDTMLRSHIDVEERLFIPALALCSDEPAWKGAVYRHEHAKLLELADDLSALLAQMEKRSPRRRAVIALIEQQRRFKQVLAHHEEREEKALLIELDKGLDLDSRQALVAHCHREWSEIFAEQRPQLKELCGRLPVEHVGGRR